MQEEHIGRIEKLKQGVKCLIEQEKEIVEQLEIVDVVQQLGLGYHFEKEIMEFLGNISNSMEATNIAMEQDLYSKAQLFRLLRESGFTVSQDVFESFKDETGSFKASLQHDTKGLLSLYQASYFAMEEENTLDEAIKFTTKHLNNLVKVSSLDPWLKEQVTYALDLPLHWRVQRLHNRWFIERYHREEKMYPILIEFAKLDFNMLQSVHQKELRELSRWWTDLDLLGDKLSFARDRFLLNYFVTIGWAFEPKFWRCREVMTKFNCVTLTIDDMYDVYGSLDELELFTDAVERWEVSAIEKLPEYMKLCFLALFNTTNDAAYKILKDKSMDIIPYLKRAWADLCKSYLMEANWYHNGYTPTLEEYLENAWVSIASIIPLNFAYCVDEDVTIETLKSFKSYPDIIRWPSLLYSLSNDLATSNAELIRGDVQKSIQCYMHEKGISETLAHQHIRELIKVY